MGEQACGCGNRDKPTRECIECGKKACEECARLTWQGNVCSSCMCSNPVFFDRHSRTVGEVNPDQGAVR